MLGLDELSCTQSPLWVIEAAAVGRGRPPSTPHFHFAFADRLLLLVATVLLAGLLDLCRVLLLATETDELHLAASHFWNLTCFVVGLFEEFANSGQDFLVGVVVVGASLGQNEGLVVLDLAFLSDLVLELLELFPVALLLLSAACSSRSGLVRVVLPRVVPLGLAGGQVRHDFGLLVVTLGIVLLVVFRVLRVLIRARL